MRNDNNPRAISLAALLCLTLLGCATAGKPAGSGPAARVSYSPTFDYRQGLRVAVFPFSVTGNPNLQRDTLEADLFCAELRDAGFTVIDSALFRDGDPRQGGWPPEGDLQQVPQALRLDLLVFGTIRYSSDAVLTGLLSKRYPVAEAASVRFVDARTAEILLLASVKLSTGPAATQLAAALRQALLQR